MKKLFAILTICGLFAISSCTKHACPAYGTTHHVQKITAQQSV